MSEQVVIPYRPRLWAKGLHNSFKRKLALVMHRRGGKTTAILNQHVRAALDDDWESARLRYLMPDVSDKHIRRLLANRVYWHVMPSYQQAKRTGAWEMLKRITEPIPNCRRNEADMLVVFPNGNRIQILGGDDPDSLRGPGLSGLSFDEYSQMPTNVFGEVLSKALADHLGWTIFSGTIKGEDHLYKTFEAAKASPEDWWCLWQPVDVSLATENGATIETIRIAMEDEQKLVDEGIMTQEEFDQEWYLSRDAAIQGAFYTKELALAREQGRIGDVPYDPTMLVDTDWDLGITVMAVWLSQSERSGSVRLIDYIEDSGGGLPGVIKDLKSRPYIYGQHWGPHDIEQREIGPAKTRKQTAAELGLIFKTTPRILVADGISAAKNMLARCWFDEKKCKRGLDALRHYRRIYNRKLSCFTQDPVPDWSSHGSDAFRGLAVRWQAPRIVEAQTRHHYSPTFDWT